MARVLKELTVVTGTYQDRSTGQDKNRYKNIGVMMEAESNGETYCYMLLDRTFNPAGIASKPGSDKIIINMFDPKPRDQDGGYGNRNHGGQDQRQQGSGYGEAGSRSQDPEDEVPF